MMWWDDGWWGIGMWFLMGVMMVAIWGGLTVLLVWLVHNSQTDRNAGQSPAFPASSAEQILAERFARGEIDEDEFKRRRAVLHSRGS